MAKPTNFQVGELVKVHFKSGDASSAKTQVFSGVVIAISGQGISKTFKVLRNASAGIKVERIYPVGSPLLEKVEVVKKPKRVRRAKLYYLSNRAKATL